MRRFALLSLLALACVLPSCRAVLGDIDKTHKRYDPIPLEQLEPGITMDDVVELLGKRTRTVGGMRYTNGVVEVWGYDRWEASWGDDSVAERRWLYFFNERLVEVGEPGHWETTADRIAREVADRG